MKKRDWETRRFLFILSPSSFSFKRAALPLLFLLT